MIVAGTVVLLRRIVVAVSLPQPASTRLELLLWSLPDSGDGAGVARSSEVVGLSDGSFDGHDALLQVGSAYRQPALITVAFIEEFYLAYEVAQLVASVGYVVHGFYLCGGQVSHAL